MKQLSCKRPVKATVSCGKLSHKAHVTVGRKSNRKAVRSAVCYAAFWNDGMSTLSCLSIVTSRVAVARSIAAARHGYVTTLKIKGPVSMATLKDAPLVADYRSYGAVNGGPSAA